MGAAIRCITDAPVPCVHMIGDKPAMMATTVMSFGLTRDTAPCSMASTNRLRVTSPRTTMSSQARSRYKSITTPVCTEIPASAMNPTATATERL